MGGMRTRLVPSDVSASMITLFRVPQNMLVVGLLLSYKKGGKENSGNGSHTRFTCLPDSLVHALAGRLKLRVFVPDQNVTIQGTRCKVTMFLRRGQAAVVDDEDIEPVNNATDKDCIKFLR